MSVDIAAWITFRRVIIIVMLTEFILNPVWNPLFISLKVTQSGASSYSIKSARIYVKFKMVESYSSIAIHRSLWNHTLIACFQVYECVGGGWKARSMLIMPGFI